MKQKSGESTSIINMYNKDVNLVVTATHTRNLIVQFLICTITKVVILLETVSPNGKKI